MAKYYEEGGEVIMLVESVQLSWMAGFVAFLRLLLCI